MPLKDYIQGNKHGKEANRLEREAMKDPFLQGALDGFENVTGDHVKIIERLENRFTHPPVVSHKKRNRLLYWPVAASVLLLIGFGIYFLSERNREHTPSFAEVQPDENKSVIPTDSSVPEFKYAKRLQREKQVTAADAELSEPPVIAENSVTIMEDKKSEKQMIQENAADLEDEINEIAIAKQDMVQENSVSAKSVSENSRAKSVFGEINLFNGSDLTGWGFVLKDDSTPPEKVFNVQNGVIHITGDPFGYMYTLNEYDNYRLHVEWRWPQEASNSGIFLYVQNDNKVWPNAIECQLHAGDAGDFVLLSGSDLAEFVPKEGETRPAFPVIKKKNASSEMPVGEWNSADITCENGTITVFINGVFQNKGTKSMHKIGHVALQSEGKDIQFRNVKLIPLK